MFAKTLALATIGLINGWFNHAPINNFDAHPPVHVRQHSAGGPTGLSPAKVKSAYHLPANGGSGNTIAIIEAYDDPAIASDLNAFSSTFGLPQCNPSNPCLEKHPMSANIRTSSGWALESALDVEWAHAIAPQAKILLIQARTSGGNDLLAAVDYARNRPDVTAVSMSWGGSEFSGQAAYDSYFTSNHGVAFFAASGDNGTGVSWPAVSPGVTGVGGTTLKLNSNGTVASETAWNGSGGGISAYEPKPAFQSAVKAPRRAVPDVSYNADPATGFAVYSTAGYSRQKGWFQVGGTSAGTPQWAAIHALGNTAANLNLYNDAAGPSYPLYLRDITTGTNGSCGSICTARPGYDFVTGLGSPLTTVF